MNDLQQALQSNVKIPLSDDPVEAILGPMLGNIARVAQDTEDFKWLNVWRAKRQPQKCRHYNMRWAIHYWICKGCDCITLKHAPR